MDSNTLRKKLFEKAEFYCSYRMIMRRLAYALEGHSLKLFPDAYSERPEGGPTNLKTKLLRQENGGPFEPYSVSLINRAASQLIGDPKTLLEVGCGTGMFSSFVANQSTGLQITASELDEKTLNWARQNRASPNIEFCRLQFQECSRDQFDLVVALEVVEHIFDYPAFLESMSYVAPKAMISTPNKNRSPFTSIANTPAYDEHVREWTSGELFWVLRCFWDKVQLYTLPNFQTQVADYQENLGYSPIIKECSVLDREEPMIAICSAPRRKKL